MNTNIQIVQFYLNNYLFLWLVVVLLLPIIPPEWAGYWKYNHNNPTEDRAKKITLLRFILHFLIDSIFVEILLNGMATFQFKQAITFIIFLVMFFDIFFRHQISREAITLVSVGILALYLERLIERGKHIKLFWGLLDWYKDDQGNQTSTQSVPPAQTPQPLQP